MITITEEIIVNADIQKVWSFIIDLEISLNINGFHKQIIIPDKFSLANNSQKFNIIHNFGLGNINMDVEISDYSPLKSIELLKKNDEKLYNGFEHTSKYELLNNDDITTIRYSTTGSFNFKIQNIPFKPLLINVMKTELLNIKNMIESSYELPKEMETKITTT